MNVVPIASEWIDIYPAIVNDGEGWVMGWSNLGCEGDEHIYQEFYRTRDAANDAAKLWELPIIFHRP